MMITGTTISATGTGNAPADKAGGSIDLTSTALTIDNGKIQAKTAGAGSGGSIQITAPTSVALSNTEVSATATGSGDAGSIIFAETANFTSNDGQITTEANTGAGGSIDIASTNPMMITGTTISATGTGNAPADKAGGSIDLTSTALTIDNGKIQAKTAGAGSGGSIQITAPTSVALSNTEVSATATGSGDAGSIIFAETANFTSNDGQITTEANTGAGGSIDIASTNPMMIPALRSLQPAPAMLLPIKPAAALI